MEEAFKTLVGISGLFASISIAEYCWIVVSVSFFSLYGN